MKPVIESQAASADEAARSSASVLVARGVGHTLFGMAWPMLAGTFAMNAYNLTDTYFVSRLGTAPLAAMGFTFPVVMILTFVAGGIGNGTTTLVSHAFGRNDRPDAARLVTHGLILMLSVAAVMSVVGYLTIDWVFGMLGAKPETLLLIDQYMKTWYLGATLMALPMMGNGILIATGDSKGASLFMIVGTMVNLALDPVFIFGLFGFPAMGIRGAALATVIAQGVSAVWLMRLFIFRHRLILSKRVLTRIAHSARRILRFAIPGVLGMMLMPLSSGIITRLTAQFGTEAVAAVGAASRIEMFAFVVPMALGMSLTPFVSQNFGAMRIDRVVKARTISVCFSLLYGILIAGIFFFAAPAMAGLFTQDDEVARILVMYIRIISFGFGMLEVVRYCSFIMTGMHRPVSATSLNVVRVVCLLIPLTLLGAYLGGLRGLFIGRLATDLIAGTIGLMWVRSVLRSATSQALQAPDTSPAQH